MVETHTILLRRSDASPLEWGFDGTVEFPPHQGGWYPVEAPGVDAEFSGQVFAYDRTALHYMTRPLPGYRLFRTVMPGWDNTAPAKRFGDIRGSTGAYQACGMRPPPTHDSNLATSSHVFINAWNEWAESAYLEPDLGWGHAYLEATRDARINARLRLRPD